MQQRARQENSTSLSQSVMVFSVWLLRVEIRYQFQQLPWRIRLSKWGQLGKAATKPKWPEGANGAGARMGKKGEIDLVQRSTLRTWVLTFAGGLDSRPTVCYALCSSALPSPLQQKKKFPVPEDH